MKTAATDLRVACRFAELLSSPQETLDALLAEGKGRWYIDGGGYFESENLRIFLLVVMQDVFQALSLGDSVSFELQAISKNMYSLAFLMVESNFYDGYSSFKEQADLYDEYATIWLLLGKLAKEWLNHAKERQIEPLPCTVSELFELSGAGKIPVER